MPSLPGERDSPADPPDAVGKTARSASPPPPVAFGDLEGRRLEETGELRTGLGRVFRSRGGETEAGGADLGVPASVGDGD